MKSTQKYVLSGIRQLIDLNKDITNFDLTFNVVSLDGSDFEAVVVDQNILDTNPNIEYKSAPGSISGNIIADRDVFQSYFLLLRCDPKKNNVECEVTIDIKEIPANPNFASTIPQPGTPPPPNKEQFTTGKSKTTSKSMASNIMSKFDFKLVLKVLVVVAALAFLYFKVFRKTSNSSSNETKEDFGSNLGTPVARLSPTTADRPSLLDIEVPTRNIVNIVPNTTETPTYKRSLPNIIIPKISSPRIAPTPITIDVPNQIDLPKISEISSVKSSVKSSVIDTATTLAQSTPPVPTPSVVSIPTPNIPTHSIPTPSIPTSSIPTPSIASSNVPSTINANLFKRLKSLELKT